MVRHTLKILQHLLENFSSVSDRFGIYALKGLWVKSAWFWCKQRIQTSICICGHSKASKDIQNRFPLGITWLVSSGNIMNFFMNAFRNPVTESTNRYNGRVISCNGETRICKSLNNNVIFSIISTIFSWSVKIYVLLLML